MDRRPAATVAAISRTLELEGGVSNGRRIAVHLSEPRGSASTVQGRGPSEEEKRRWTRRLQPIQSLRAGVDFGFDLFNLKVHGDGLVAGDDATHGSARRLSTLAAGVLPTLSCGR